MCENIARKWWPDWSTTKFLLFQSDKLESDFYDLADTEIRLSHSFGSSQTDGGMVATPRGTLVIKNFKGPKFTIDQNPLSQADLDSLEVRTKSSGLILHLELLDCSIGADLP